MSRQFGRVVSLKIGDDAGVALDLSSLRVSFQVRNATTATPKEATIRVYNLSPETEERISEEFTQVELMAGYEDPGPSMIFQGEIAIVHQNRRGTTTYIELVCQDSDKAINYGVVNTTLAAGWTPDDVYKTLLDSLAAYGVSAGYKPEFTTEAGLRGYTMYGMTSAYLTVLAKQQGCEWIIEDKKLAFIPAKGAIPGTTPVLNALSGLLGVPEQTVDGVIATCLLRPEIKTGTIIQIDNAAIATAKLNESAYKSAEVPPFFAGTDKDGFYKALCVTHVGDNRGEDWLTDMVCIAVDGTAPIGGPTLDAVPSG